MSDLRIPARASLGFLLALQLLGNGSIILNSQTTIATVLGTVTDGTGAAVPGVSVRVKNVDTGAAQSTLTDDAGRFRVPSLSIGTYEVEAAKTGFKTIVRRPVTLGVSGSVLVDFSLEIGPSEETVYVEAVTPLVETHSPALSSISTFNERQLQNLPLNGRNLSELITMNPGVAMAPMGSAALKNGDMGMSMLTTIYASGESHSVMAQEPKDRRSCSTTPTFEAFGIAARVPAQSAAHWVSRRWLGCRCSPTLTARNSVAMALS
jgi:hypothetical protein